MADQPTTGSPAQPPAQGVSQNEPIYVLPPNELVPETVMSAAQLADSRDWGHGPLALEACHLLSLGKGVKVAVLDTGCDLTHPDLQDRVVLTKDFTNSRSGPSDVQGHGTHCAGIVGASSNGSGILGTAPECQLLIGKVLGDNGSGTTGWINEGIRWALASGANVISMSLGGGEKDPRTSALLEEAVRMGVYVFVAFGNEGPGRNTGGEPGKDPNVFGIAAMDNEFRIANFSSRGPEVDFACPGVQIRSCYPGGRYAVLSGTSMATPYGAGIAAVYLSYLSSLGIKWPSPKDLYKQFRETAKDLGQAGFDEGSGWGLLQPLTLMRSVKPPVTNPSPPPEPVPSNLRYRIVTEVYVGTGKTEVISVEKLT